MPKGPKGQKRPADVIGNAVKVMRIATGEEEEEYEDDGKDPAAKALGAKGGEGAGVKAHPRAAVSHCSKGSRSAVVERLIQQFGRTCYVMFALGCGGGGGIRTHETLRTFAGFKDRCNEPLCHTPLSRTVYAEPRLKLIRKIFA